MTTRVMLIIATVVLMIVFVIGNFVIDFFLPTVYSLNTFNQPTIGDPKSKIEVVAFLDPKSQESRNYNNEVFPQIQKNYIEKDAIKYSVIIVAPNNESMPAAELLLCTYYQDENTPNSQLFFTLLNYLYLNPTTTQEHLLSTAEKADPSINLEKIKRCMDRHVYFTRIQQNNSDGSSVTSRKNNYPALFVNGTRVDASNIVKAIDNANIKK